MDSEKHLYQDFYGKEDDYEKVKEFTKIKSVFKKIYLNIDFSIDESHKYKTHVHRSIFFVHFYEY